MKVDVQVLEPDSGYYYRFRTGARVSPVGVEFACASVSSPGGAELVVGLETADQFAPFAVTLIDDLRYTNLVNRGYIALSFTADQVSGEWRYVSGVDMPDYTVDEAATTQLTVSRDNLILG